MHTGVDRGAEREWAGGPIPPPCGQLTRCFSAVAGLLVLIGGIIRILVYTGHYAYRQNNFIVGLTNASPATSRPTLWNYTLCGQYPGAVPAAATVSLYCPYNLPPFRYLVVQSVITDHMNICELEVITPGT